MSETLTLEYNLAELPSSQHRAGLAGLVLMARWLAKEPDIKGICEITQIDEISATLQIDQEGLQFLFDKVYAASKEDQERDKVSKNSRTKEIIPYKNTIEKSILNEKTGESEKKTFYIYPQVIPHGAFLVDYDKSENGIWIKLWRDLIWGVLCSRDKQRIPYKKRANKEDDANILKLWNYLVKSPNKELGLSSSLFIGAEGSNAEDVSFNDIAKNHFLLNFWVFATQIYAPKEWKYDRKTKSEKAEDVGFSLVIPDIGNLEAFCEEMPDILKSRNNKPSGYRPKESVIDVVAECGLDLMNNINQRLKTKTHLEVNDLLLGVDVFHLHKPKNSNSVKILEKIRINPIRPMIDEYARVKERFNNRIFHKQRMLNVLNDKDWFYGFDSLLSKTDSEQTIGQSFFRSDIRKAFEDIGVTNRSKGANNMDTTTQEVVPKTIEEIAYRLVGTYISAKLKSKYQLEWTEGYKGTPKEVEYNEKKGKVAREAFLAIRSRTESDFVDYFTSTLCAFPQFLNEQGYATLAKALHEESDKVRTLTMLALSARG